MKNFPRTAEISTKVTECYVLHPVGFKAILTQ